MAVPKYDKMMNPTLQALDQLGGSASITELEEAVAKIMKLSDEDVSQIHRGNRTKFTYRLAWTRTFLKWYGLIENSSRGIWALTSQGSKIQSVDPKEVKQKVASLHKAERDQQPELEEESEGEPIGELSWKEELLGVVQELSPPAFERLCKRMLRESGFIQVEVTGKSGDGGIDGKGVVKIGGLLSFHVIFQCKRYKGRVSSSVVRDFRGAMVGRADKGLLITTGSFTRDARSEAQRDGAPPIDLIDGDELSEKLKYLNIGVEVETKSVEVVKVKRDWFSNL